MNAIVDEVKAELTKAKLQRKCPKCGSRVLTAVYTRYFRIDLVSETSEEVEENGTLLGVHCDKCGWCIDDVVEETEEKV